MRWAALDTWLQHRHAPDGVPTTARCRAAPRHQRAERPRRRPTPRAPSPVATAGGPRHRRDRPRHACAQALLREPRPCALGSGPDPASRGVLSGREGVVQHPRVTRELLAQRGRLGRSGALERNASMRPAPTGRQRRISSDPSKSRQPLEAERCRLWQRQPQPAGRPAPARQRAVLKRASGRTHLCGGQVRGRPR